ncbi:uncharacterized protein EI90DRAFT_3060751 [Cantharellus anzutake]|uniref:uncharacterized protein n=1 Tax=Cantharellus anzutake TaxID=1750568 RepID=UPI0019075DF8|nr:uncharacterized protein EI90DRAFT_3060751 [Cantharellus anzutake]KAF8330439.1 hypothetical protein EI90DRAFT_3060751 [Cantharellus anzutake]
MAGEFDIIGKFPDAAHTSQNVAGFQSAMQELKTVITPELELIQSRILGPCKELQGIMKTIRKNITKRDHKLIDYDRFNNSLTKLRDKKEKTLNDEKNLFKLEQDFEQASADYELYNTNMKTDLPNFLVLATQFIDPLFHSFFYMQLNIFYLMLEKIQEFANGKYETTGTIEDITENYEARRGDARETIEGMNINKRMISTAKLVHTRRQDSGLTGSTSLNRSTSSATTSSSVSRSVSGKLPPPAPSSSFTKKPPPPPPNTSAKPSFTKPPSANSASAINRSVSSASTSIPTTAPPPYTPASSTSTNVSSIAGTKRPPPPIPANKPKAPPPQSQPVYVIALYDFEAQADGDLSFKVGDHIEIVKRSDSAEDWWTGKVNGVQGVFPGNYVQDA